MHIDAALAATVLVSALRGARRAGAGLAEQAHRADHALAGHGHGHATGQLLRIDLHTGQARFVNAGHPCGRLEDDATVMCLDRHGPQERQRHVSSGADTRQASARRTDQRP
ncbi:SpoIIE family protein phosphatase [Streptomyces sp. NPDC020377]|uniref:SpoIIE family protein phosphatase n=1 Tax=unclassified Streptomyces TaxID=2593676 RepID=UPI00039E2FDB